MTTIRVNGFRQLTNGEIRELAADRLIREQRCSTLKTDYYSEIVFGKDLNILDYSRHWYWRKIKEMSPNEDSERLRISANKQVFYVNASELAETISLI